MKIKSIEFKNIASYGNKVQKIEFSDDKAELYLTLGKNGDGKTTIANAIIFALYGKVEGVRMSDLPNRINRELWVRIKLQCGTMDIEIERGLAPSRFSVLVNGVEFDKAGKRSVQEYLEEEVYGIPYHVFKNIIILSVNDFKINLIESPLSTSYADTYANIKWDSSLVSKDTSLSKIYLEIVLPKTNMVSWLLSIIIFSISFCMAISKTSFAGIETNGFVSCDQMVNAACDVKTPITF